MSGRKVPNVWRRRLFTRAGVASESNGARKSEFLVFSEALHEQQTSHRKILLSRFLTVFFPIYFTLSLSAHNF